MRRSNALPSVPVPFSGYCGRISCPDVHACCTSGQLFSGRSIRKPYVTAPRNRLVSRCSDAVRPADRSETYLSVGRTAPHRQQSVRCPSCAASTAMTPIWRCHGSASTWMKSVVARAPRGVPNATDALWAPDVGVQRLGDPPCTCMVDHQDTLRKFLILSTTFPWELELIHG